MLFIKDRFFILIAKLILLVMGFFESEIIYSDSSQIDFDSLAGVRIWKKEEYSREDILILNCFRSLFEKNIDLFFESNQSKNIPEVFHIIWLGEKSFPETSCNNLRSLQKHNPTWKFKFWTDSVDRPVPMDGMEKQLIQDLVYHYVGKYVPLTKNYGEQSDLLRYEILFQEGGVYVDHDVECFRSFSTLNANYDFYACLEPLHNGPTMNLKCFVTNCLIGARAGHPILKQTMELIDETWGFYQELLPGNDETSIVHRVLNRTFNTFNIAVNREIDRPGNKDIIFPGVFIFPTHFPRDLLNLVQEKKMCLGNHKWENTWFRETEQAMY